MADFKMQNPLRAPSGLTPGSGLPAFPRLDFSIFKACTSPGIVQIHESKTLRCTAHSGLHRVLTPGSGLPAFPRLDFSFLSIFTNCTSPGIVQIHEWKTLRCKTHSGLHRVLTPGSGLAAFPRTYWAVIFRLGLQDLSFFRRFVKTLPGIVDIHQ